MVRRAIEGDELRVAVRMFTGDALVSPLTIRSHAWWDDGGSPQR